MAIWIKMPLGIELGLSPGDFVSDGEPALPSPERGQRPPPQFSAHFYCGQTTACIKMPLGKEVGIGPCHDVLDGDPTQLNSTQRASMDAGVKTPQCPHLYIYLDTISYRPVGTQPPQQPLPTFGPCLFVQTLAHLNNKH